MNFLKLLLVIAINISLVLAGDVYKCIKDNTRIYGNNKGQNDVGAWLDTGDYIFATEVSNGYAKFYKGYVNLSGLQKQTSTTKNYKVTAQDGLYFNAGPGTNYKSLTLKTLNTGVVYYGRDWWVNSWGITNFGYCLMDYLAVCSECNTSSTTGVYKCTKDNTRIYGNNKGQNYVGAWLDTGDYIFATGVSNGYAKFYKGYVNLSNLQKQTSTKTNCKVKASNGLNFYSGPGTSYTSRTKKNNNVGIVYYGRDWWDNNWGITNLGYCSVSYLTCTSSGGGGGSTTEPTTREGKIKAIYDYFISNVPGATKAGIAAVLGCWDIESGIEPKRAEGDYYDPPIGTSNNRNSALYDDESWLNMTGPEIYNGSYPRILKRGLGLGQWTDTPDASRNSELRKYAKSKGRKWYELTLQLDFMINGDNAYAIKMAKQVLTSQDSVNNLTAQFLSNWEGVPGDKLSQRQASAYEIYTILSNY